MDVQLTLQTQIQPQVKRININLSLFFQFMTIREWEVPDSQGNQAKKQTVSTFTAGNAQQAQQAQRATKLLKQCHCHRMTTFSLVSLFSCLFTCQHKSSKRARVHCSFCLYLVVANNHVRGSQELCDDPYLQILIREVFLTTMHL